MPNKLKEIKKHTRTWKSLPFTSRREEVIITRTRIGHSLLSHRHLLSKEDKPTCKYCRSQLSIKHITLECPKFNDLRSILENPNSMERALGEKNSHNILNYFKLTGVEKLL